MKKLLLALLCASAFAQSSFDIAKTISNADEAKLRLLFSKDYLDAYTRPNIEKISEILQTNSLFKIALDSPRDINLQFYAKGDSILFLNAITNMLSSLGFVHFYITEFSKLGEQMSLKITLQSSFLVDPGQVYKQLRQNRIYITSLDRLAHGDYSYELDLSRFFISADMVVSKGKEYKLSKPLRMYFMAVENGVSKLDIKSNPGDIWYPKVEFLDHNLGLIDGVYSVGIARSVEIDIPQGCKYIRLGDNFAIENIKRGLNITAK